MRTHVGLLRAINVGGRDKVPMADLRELMTSLGLADVATYARAATSCSPPRSEYRGLAELLDQPVIERFEVTTTSWSSRATSWPRSLGTTRTRSSNPRTLHGCSGGPI